MPDDFSIKALINSVLAATGFSEKRARQMDIDDFLLLLKGFNEVGLRFR